MAASSRAQSIPNISILMAFVYIPRPLDVFICLPNDYRTCACIDEVTYHLHNTQDEQITNIVHLSINLDEIPNKTQTHHITGFPSLATTSSPDDSSEVLVKVGTQFMNMG